ncbi:hypothetical protein [Paracoccus sp. ME4]|uniref:hypothetical protein n=1 Tax=Paracoccus sp. ME4 TaxID=3138066 RepID=UPI00398B9993
MVMLALNPNERQQGNTMTRWAEDRATEELGYRAQGDAMEVALKWGFIGALLSLLVGFFYSAFNGWYLEETTQLGLWFALGGAAAGFLKAHLRDRRWDRRLSELERSGIRG